MTTEQKLAAVSAGAAVIAAFLAAGIYLGFLEGRIASLNTERIAEERDKAIQTIRDSAGNPTLTYHSLSVPSNGVEVYERMIPVDSGACFLTQVRGKFEGGGEMVWIEARDGWWDLIGHSDQIGVLVGAHCLTWPAHSKQTTQ